MSCQKHFKELDKSFFQDPKELGDLLNKANFVHKYLPKQTDIDKILEVIQRKVLTGTHLPMEGKRNSGRLSMQSIFQRLISISVTK